MRKQYIRWIVPMIALLLIATALVFSTVATYAKGPAHTHAKSASVSAPTLPIIISNSYWGH